MFQDKKINIIRSSNWLCKVGLIGRCIDLSCSSTREDGLDHDSSAPASYDAKTKPFAIIDQLYHLHMALLTWQRLERR